MSEVLGVKRADPNKQFWLVRIIRHNKSFLKDERDTIWTWRELDSMRFDTGWATRHFMRPVFDIDTIADILELDDYW